jgi:hypothetical protein
MGLSYVVIGGWSLGGIDAQIFLAMFGASAPVYTDSRHELWGEGAPIRSYLRAKSPTKRLMLSGEASTSFRIGTRALSIQITLLCEVFGVTNRVVLRSFACRRKGGHFEMGRSI